jgi:signal transduction histidine kinase/CheY-like chemotaxis protein
MLGRSLHMVRGLSLHEVLHHVGAVELHSPGACRLLHACAASESLTGEDVVLRQSGELLAVAFAASPIPGGVGSVVELRDITQQKASERERAELLAREQRARLEAERSNKAKDEFLAMLGHELRNPLAAISNASHVLDRTGGSAADQAKAIMRRQAQHLARLVDDLIDAGRVTTGKIVLVQQPVALDAVVQRALATPGLAGRSESHELIVRCEPATVFGDETRLEQIVSNLLTNAFRYTPNGGTVTVTLAAEDDQAVLTVQDTGFGIEPAMLPRIFELFFQGERGIERAQGGLGIGLTLVKRLVEQHGGTVEAQSDGQNRGSRFTVRLPLLKQAAHAVAAAPPKAAAAPQRILIVEDNADVRSMLATVLQMAGHEVLEAPDGPSAIETAARTLPDTVILDIGLPGLSGYEVAERIRTMAPLAHTRLIALSGYGQDQDRAQAAQAGFNAHLVKPVAPDLLLATLA